MSAFTKVQDCITQKNANSGHLKVNLENIRSLIKAKKEIESFLVQHKNMKSSLLTSKDS